MPDLSGIPALDVAIGLAFLYFLLSTACSGLNESIANVLGWRAKTLEDAVRNMLGDPEVKRGWMEWMGRIDKRGVKQDVAIEREGVRVPADLASAVFDHWRIKALVRDPRSSWRRRRRPSYLPPRAFSLAVAETLAAGAPARAEGPSLWEETDAEILARAQTTLERLPDGQVRRALQKAAANAGGTLDGFRRQLETAFDDAMERASGWYRRKIQVMVVVLAAALAVGLNVDSVRVANRLWNDEATRAAVVRAQSEKGAQGAADAVGKVNQLQLPVGWGAGNAPEDLGDALQRIPGWLVTIAALSLGAPFWFDLLGRLARVRGTGPPKQPRSASHTPAAATADAGPGPR